MDGMDYLTMTIGDAMNMDHALGYLPPDPCCAPGDGCCYDEGYQDDVE